MQSNEPPKGLLHSVATMLFFIGLGLSIALSTPWIGIALMVVGVLISISLVFGLFGQSGSKQR